MTATRATRGLTSESLHASFINFHCLIKREQELHESLQASVLHESFINFHCSKRVVFFRCGSRGSCQEYDNEKLIYITAAVATVSKFFTMVFFILAWKFLKPPPTVVEANGNGGINYTPREATDSSRSDTTLIDSANV